MTRMRDGNYVWVTWLAKLMAGEVKCVWAPWFRAHYMGYPKAPSDFQLAVWTAEHTQALSELAFEREALGENVYKEDQNSFRLKVTPDMVLAGKPDIVVIDSDGKGTVFDMKTGSQKHSDLIQVMLYMLCLPAASPLYRGKALSGCVVYKNGERSVVPPWAIDDAFKRNARYFINLLDAVDAPKHTPSAQECRYCDITAADCPERIEWVPAEAEDETPVIDWGSS